MRTITSLNIKNLSIAMEALSRINGQNSIMYAIETLLKAEINLAKEQAKPQTLQSAQTSDDEIPF